MLKVTKFGGSSLADAKQFKKVKDIIAADDRRVVVVVSAPGKRNGEDIKVTDLLYLCHAHLQSVSYTHLHGAIRDIIPGMFKKSFILSQK